MTSEMSGSAGHSPAPLRGRWRSFARLAWIVSAAAYLIFWGLGTYQRLAVPLSDCREVVCDNIEFSSEDVEQLAKLDLPPFIDHRVWITMEIPYSLGFIAIAGLIFWRRSDRVIGVVLSIALIYAGAVLFSAADDSLRRGYPELRAIITLFDIVGVLALLLALLTFPDGRFSGRWAPTIAGALFAIVVAVPLLSGGSSRLQGPEVPPAATALWMLMFLTMLAVGVYSQVRRYRFVSTELQRQQTKWVLFGMMGQIFVVAIWGYIGFAYPPSEPSPTRVAIVLVAHPVILVLSSMVPVSVAFAILRYRLFDIDRLINRTLVYALLTALLALVYFIGVALFQNLFSLLSFGGSPLAVVLSTLAIAWLFSPLRQRVQAFIDRRFYRRRYDMQKTLSTFGSHMREKLDLDTLLDELISVTDEVLKPEYASVWIRGRDAAGPAKSVVNHKEEEGQ